MENIVAPNRRIKAMHVEEERVKMMAYTAPGRGESTDFLKRYRLWLLKKINADFNNPITKNLYKSNTTIAINISYKVANKLFNESNYFKLKDKLGIGEDNNIKNRIYCEFSKDSPEQRDNDYLAHIVLGQRVKEFKKVIRKLSFNHKDR